MLAWIEDTSGREHTSFDARGRVEWTVKQIPDPVLAPTLEFQLQTAVAYKTAYEYDSLDRVTRMIYPDNDEVRYQYNARSLLKGIIGGPSGHLLSGLSYLPSAQQQQIEYGNGVRTTYDYDARQRLSRLFTQHATRNTELVHFAYDLDPVSNIDAIHDQRPAPAVPLDHPRRNSQRFAYDSLYRLTRAQYNSPNPATANGGEINYRYDRIGNMLAQTSDIAHTERGAPVTDLGAMNYGGAAGRTGRTGRQPGDPPGPHALTSIRNSTLETRNYPYDANGNMTVIDGMSCTWDFKDRLVAVEDDAMRADYRYDFSGRRVIKRVIWKEGGPAHGSNAPPVQPAKSASTSALYPEEHFEVRDTEQPTKYVFNGSTRVAQVIGSLSANERIQRLRLMPGPNLVSLAVTAQDLASQLKAGTNLTGSVVRALYRWSETTGSYAKVNAGQTVPAGTILWIQALTNATLNVTGSYDDPARGAPEPGTRYIAGPGLESWCPRFPALSSTWAYSTPERRWQAQFSDDLMFVSDLAAPISTRPGTLRDQRRRHRTGSA
jgi:hypothetical protein